MSEKLVELNNKLKAVVEKFEQKLPVFNKHKDEINLVMRIEFADNDETFLHELNLATSKFMDSVSDADINYLIKIHKTKYRYGFLMPSQAERYEELFQAKY